MLSVSLSVRNHSITWVVATVLAHVFSAQPGYAQQDTLRGTNPTLSDSIAAISAWAKSDTGRMMPGYRDLSRYSSPGMCLVAMRGLQDAIWRRGETDTIPRYSAGDTTPTAVKDLGRSCLADMTPEKVDSAQLFDLMAAAIRAGDTALARNTVLYHASKITAGKRELGFLFFDAMLLSFQSQFSQWVWAESLFPKIAELGPDALEPLGSALGLRLSVAGQRFDTAAMIRLGVDRKLLFESLIANGAELDSFWIAGIYRDSMSIVDHRRRPGFLEEMERLGDRYIDMYSGTELGRQMAAGNIEADLRIAKIYGTPAPAELTMFRHYPREASVRPIPGRVTIVGYTENLGEGFIEPYLATLRRLHDKYHDSGLDIMLIAQTKGFAWRSPPLDSAEEAKLIGWYYREHLKLPFTILVAVADFGRLEDGRITRRPPSSLPSIGVYRYWRPHWWYIVARDGTITGRINGRSSVHQQEFWLEAVIRRELDIQSHAQKP